MIALLIGFLLVSGETSHVEKPKPGDLTLGITLDCPYGLRVCYPEIRDGLTRLPGVEVVSPTADGKTWTCRIQMKRGQLIRPSTLDRYLKTLHVGAHLRHIEATVKGQYKVKGGRPFLVVGKSTVLLRPLADSAYWNVAQKKVLMPTPGERKSLNALCSSVRPGAEILVTGVLATSESSEAASIEVRTYEPAIEESRSQALGADLFVPDESIPTYDPYAGEQSVNTRVAAPVPLIGASSVGSWSTPMRTSFSTVHTHLSWTGEVLLSGIGTFFDKFDPVSETITPLISAPYQFFCSGHTQLSDGTLFFAGGAFDPPHPSGDGSTRGAIYDPVKGTWQLLPSMGISRWYPTVVELTNGNVLVFAGETTPLSLPFQYPQIWNGKSWINLTGAKLAEPGYPTCFLAPDGRVFIAGPLQTSMYLNTSGLGSFQTGPKRIFPNRDYGPIVEYEPGKLFYIGGANPPTATTEAIDLTAAKPAWKAMAPMHFPRQQANATILPDGTVFVNGGTYSAGFDNPLAPVYAGEIWDPITDKWTVVASQKIYRGYHSTSILMPDGRVLTSGGNAYPWIEIYSPPYLFQGPRPTIAIAPKTATPGRYINVTTPNASSIAKVSWVRVSSTTHTRNLDQRFQWLTFTSSPHILSITAPQITPMNPAGYYMLFLINTSGVPSVGKIIQLLPPGSGSKDP